MATSRCSWDTSNQHALGERSGVVRAAGVRGVEGIAHARQQHLGAALDCDLHHSIERSARILSIPGLESESETYWPSAKASTAASSIASAIRRCWIGFAYLAGEERAAGKERNSLRGTRSLCLHLEGNDKLTLRLPLLYLLFCSFPSVSASLLSRVVVLLAAASSWLRDTM